MDYPKFFNFFLPKNADADTDKSSIASMRVKACIIISFFALVVCLLYFTFHLSTGCYIAALFDTIPFFVVILALYFLRVWGKVLLAGNLIILSIFGPLFATIYYSGGIDSSSVTTFILLPAMGIVIMGLWPGIIWTVMSIAAVIYFYIVDFLGGKLPVLVETRSFDRAQDILVTLVLIVVMMSVYEDRNLLLSKNNSPKKQ